MWIHIFTFRRELLSGFDCLWPFIESYDGERRKEVPGEIHSEFLDLIVLLPLAIFNMRAEVSEEFTISDASETGAGMCSAAALSTEGMLHFPK